MVLLPGDYEEISDIDILVIVPCPVNTSLREEIFSIAFDVELEYDVIFGVIVYSKNFWDSELARVMPLHKNIEKEGVHI